MNAYISPLDLLSSFHTREMVSVRTISDANHTMLIAMAGRARPNLQRRNASDIVLTIHGAVYDDKTLVDRAEFSDTAQTCSPEPNIQDTCSNAQQIPFCPTSVSSDATVVSRSTVCNSPEVNITVDEVGDDDDDDDSFSSETHLPSREISSTTSTVRNSPVVNITVDEVSDDDDDHQQDGEESHSTPHSPDNTISSNNTTSAGSVEYVEYATDAHALDASHSVDFVQKPDTAVKHNVYTYTFPQPRQSRRNIVQQKIWYHLETIEEVLSPIADTVELPPTFTQTLSLTTRSQTQETDILHKQFPLLVVESIKNGDDMGELPLAFVA